MEEFLHQKAAPGVHGSMNMVHVVLEELDFPCQLQHGMVPGVQTPSSRLPQTQRNEISPCQREKCDSCNVLPSDLNAIRWLIQQKSADCQKVLFLDSNCDCTHWLLLLSFPPNSLVFPAKHVSNSLHYWVVSYLLSPGFPSDLSLIFVLL